MFWRMEFHVGSTFVQLGPAPQPVGGHAQSNLVGGVGRASRNLGGVSCDADIQEISHHVVVQGADAQAPKQVHAYDLAEVRSGKRV